MLKSFWITNEATTIIYQSNKSAYIGVFPIAKYIRRQFIVQLLRSKPRSRHLCLDSYPNFPEDKVYSGIRTSIARTILLCSHVQEMQL